MTDYKIDKVEKVSKSVKAFKQYVEKQAPHGVPSDRQYFEALMRQEKKVEQLAPENTKVDKTEKPSLMDAIQKVNRRVSGIQKTTSVNLIAQAQSAATEIEQIRRTLDAPALEIKGSVQRLLKGKLSSINENLKVAFAKAGVEYIPPEKVHGRDNPVEHFLNYLAHGQYQLESLGTHINGLADSGRELSPADLLAVQIKVHHVQQELEFFSNLLNKSLESTKTLMNVQV